MEQPGVRAAASCWPMPSPGPGLCRFAAEPQTARNESDCGQPFKTVLRKAYSQRRTRGLACGFEAGRGCVAGGTAMTSRLVRSSPAAALDDDAVFAHSRLVMAEPWRPGKCRRRSGRNHLKVDLRGLWQADEHSFELVRDRPGRQRLAWLRCRPGGRGTAIADKTGRSRSSGTVWPCEMAGPGSRTGCPAGWNSRSKTITARGSLKHRGGLEPGEGIAAVSSDRDEPTTHDLRARRVPLLFFRLCAAVRTGCASVPVECGGFCRDLCFGSIGARFVG